MSKQSLVGSCILLAIVGLAYCDPLIAQQADNSFETVETRPAEAIELQPAQLAQTAEERIEAALEQKLKTPLSYDGEQLNIILEAIADEYDISIVFNNVALDEVAISKETEVTINLRNVSLRSALNLMLKEPGLEDLTYVIDEEVLLITTEEQANGTLKVKVYPVEDLLQKTRRFNSSELSVDFDSLINVITACVDAASWMENETGEAEVQPFPPGMLVITQTERNHRKVQELLDQLRETKKQMDAGEKASTETNAKIITRGIGIQLDQGENPARIREQLAMAIQTSVDWSVAGTSLTKQEAWLVVLPDRVVARHSPKVLDQISLVLADMGVSNPAQAYGGSRFGR